MNPFIKIFAIISVLAVGMHFSIDYIFKNIKQETDGIKSKVGQKIVLENDTIMIVDYSLLNDNYVLSNGKIISFELAKKLKTVK